jgi:hypothetical protein
MNWSELRDTTGNNLSSFNLKGSELEQPTAPEVVLAQVYELLETYGPKW